MFDLLKHLSNESLDALASEVYRERERRVDVDSMPAISQEERGLWYSGRRVMAIETYRNRTKTDSVMACKRKLETLDIDCTECHMLGNTHKMDCSKR